MSKEKETKSKLKPINYTELKMQYYLVDPPTSKDEKRNLFQWRTRMSKSFGENFRGGRKDTICKFCNGHLDSQDDFFYNCPYLQKKIEVKGNYYQLFNESIPAELINTLTKISKLRDD